jgi:hypothetical protein
MLADREADSGAWHEAPGNERVNKGRPLDTAILPALHHSSDNFEIARVGGNMIVHVRSLGNLLSASIEDSHDADTCLIRALARQLGSKLPTFVLSRPAISLNRRRVKALAGWRRVCRFQRHET